MYTYEGNNSSSKENKVVVTPRPWSYQTILGTPPFQVHSGDQSLHTGNEHPLGPLHTGSQGLLGPLHTGSQDPRQLRTRPTVPFITSLRTRPTVASAHRQDLHTGSNPPAPPPGMHTGGSTTHRWQSHSQAVRCHSSAHTHTVPPGLTLYIVVLSGT